TFTGAATDFDSLAQQAAEAVYRVSQPYRYTEFLEDQDRIDEAFAVISDLAVNGPRIERGWAYAKWSVLDLNRRADLGAARLHAAKGLGFGAGSDTADRISIISTAVWSSHEELDLVQSRLIVAAAQQR